MRKKALITGITGQDGSYLAEFLIGKGYEVFGMVRRTSSFSAGRIYPLMDDQTVKLVEGDLLDAMSLRKAIETVLPDEIYNLGAMSDVKSSFHLAEYTSEVNGIGVLRLLEAICDINPKIRFYQASTSELFGKAQQFPQTEKTPFHPRSPYGISKLYGFWIVTHFREAYQLFACNGILFNHESPRRGESFVSRKISLGVASIILGLNKKLSLGNLNARRDWGYAKDFVEGMWLMLQQEKADDFVLATGKTHTVREFVERSFQEFGIHIVWEGEGIDEKGVDSSTGRILVDISKDFFRPSEVDHLIGDPSKAYRQLGWQSNTSFEELVSLMVQSDYKYLSDPKRHFEPCFS